MKNILKNNILIETEGDTLIIDKRNTFFSKSKMVIKIKEIVGIIQWNDMILIVGNGFPIQYELSEKNREIMKRLPNSIMGNEEEIEKIYEKLYILVQNIPNM